MLKCCKILESSGNFRKISENKSNREKTGESYVKSPFMENQWLTGATGFVSFVELGHVNFDLTIGTARRYN